MSFFHDITRYAPREKFDQGEDRLTEITRVTLERVDGLAIEFAKALDAELPDWLSSLSSFEQPDVQTQVRVRPEGSSGGRADLVITFKKLEDGGRSQKLVLLVEVKHGADVHGNQMHTYSEYLRELHEGDGAETDLVILAPSKLRKGQQWYSTEDGLRVRICRWDHVARKLRAYLNNNQQITDSWLLDDYLEYLKGEGLMEADAFVPAELAGLARATRAIRSLDEQLAKSLAEYWGAEVDAGRAGKEAAFHNFETQDELEGWMEFTFRRVCELNLPEEQSDDLVLLAGRSWTASEPIDECWKVEDEDFRRFELDRHGRQMRLLKFSDFSLESAQNLHDQVHVITQWIYESFRACSTNQDIAPFDEKRGSSTSSSDD